LFTNGQVGTKPDGSTPEATADQAEVIFGRLTAVLERANMTLGDIVRFNVYLTDQADVKTFVAVRDSLMGDHKPAATLIVVRGLSLPELKIEIEVVAAKVD
jgi:enamine deaminase RidA (YjgF/YER057c/UK114 family)